MAASMSLRQVLVSVLVNSWNKGIGCPSIRRIPAQYYSKKAVAPAATPAKTKGPAKKKDIQVEEDPERLCKFLCGGNIYKEGQDPELKPDSEYPDWLWTLLDKPKELKPFSQMTESEVDDLDTKDWRRLRKIAFQRQSMLKKVKRKG